MPLTSSGMSYVVNQLFSAITHIYIIGENNQIICTINFDNEAVIKSSNNDAISISVNLPTSDQRISQYLPMNIYGIGAGTSNLIYISEYFASPKQVSSSNSALVISWDIRIMG